jgi:hypothetical protein
MSLTTPLTLRYNNPGAVEFKPWMSAYGAVPGPNGRYAQFPGPEQGYQVMSRILDTYQNKHGLNNVAGIVNRWAPPQVDNNSTPQYIASVSRSLGVDPNAPLKPEQRQGLMQAMAAYEAGRAPAPMSANPVQPVSSPSPSPGATPMALTDSQPQPQGFSLDNWMMSPLFQMGAGVLGAPNIGQGLMQGSQAAAGFAQNRRKAQREDELFPLQKQLMQAQIKKAAEPASSDDIREFQFARNDGFTGSFADWMKQKREMNGATAQQVTWGRDAAGNYVPMQASRDGKLVQSVLPPGVTPVPAEVLAFERASAKEQGEALGKARATLPSAETNAKLMLEAIQGVRNLDPKVMATMTGTFTGVLPNVSKEAVDAQAKIDQVQGKAFLAAFDGLRGGGAITEAEGAKATAAVSRLQAMRVGTEAYKRALDDVEKEVTALLELARKKASAAAPNPSVRPQQAPTSQPIDLGDGIKLWRRD